MAAAPPPPPPPLAARIRVGSPSLSCARLSVGYFRCRPDVLNMFIPVRDCAVTLRADTTAGICVRSYPDISLCQRAGGLSPGCRSRLSALYRRQVTALLSPLLSSPPSSLRWGGPVTDRPTRPAGIATHRPSAARRLPAAPSECASLPSGRYRPCNGALFCVPANTQVDVKQCA